MKPKHKILLLLVSTFIFSCTEEYTTENISNNYYTTNTTTTAEGLGKVNVYIEGDITNEQAVEKLKKEVGSLTENIYVRNTTALTSLTITPIGSMQNIEVTNTENLTNLVINAKESLYDIKVKTNKNLANLFINAEKNFNDIEISNNSELSELDINGTNNIKANNIYIYSNNILSDVLVKKIKTINNFSIVSDGVVLTLNCYDLEEINEGLSISLSSNVENKINFPDLKHIGLGFDSGSYFGGKYNVLNFPKLESISSLLLWQYSRGLEINTLTFPSLKSIKSLEFDYGCGIQNLNLPLLERCDNFYFKTAKPLISMPKLKYCKNYKSGTSGLTNSEVDLLLYNFLYNITEPATGKTINLFDELAPTDQGKAYKQELINQGNTVITS